MITFTLKPEFCKQKKARNQLIKTFDSVEFLLKTFTSAYVVVAELTKTCNVHYHALIKWSQTMEYADLRFRDCMKNNRILGFFDITEKVKSVNDTFNYITKDIKKTSTIVNIGKSKSICVWRESKSSSKTVQMLSSTYELDFEEMDDDEIIQKHEQIIKSFL